MPEAFFKAGKKGRLPLRFHIDDPIGIKSGLTESGGEEICPGQAPDHWSGGSRHHSGDEESRRRRMQRSWAAACDLMKTAERQPALWQESINFRNAERQDAGCALPNRSDPSDPGAQVIESGTRQWGRHGRTSGNICSSFVLFGAASQFPLASFRLDPDGVRKR